MHQIGHYVDGRVIEYDSVTGDFFLSGAAVSIEYVFGYSQAGQLNWASDEIRDWFYALPLVQSQLSVDAGVPGVRRTSMPKWLVLLLVGVVTAPFLLCIAMALVPPPDNPEGPSTPSPRATQSTPAESVETTAERAARIAKEREQEAQAAAEEKKQAELAAVRGTDDYKALTSGGMNDEQARSLIAAAKVAGINDIGETTSKKKAEGKGDVFIVSCWDGDIDLDYTVLFNGNKVSRIHDKEDAVLYAKGKRNDEYIFWEDVGGPVFVRDMTKSAITAILKAPSTADFPGGFLDPLDGWGFKKTPGQVGITGYVDSQNSFGAMLRSQFKVIYRVSTGKDRGTLTPIYINFDGEVMLDER